VFFITKRAEVTRIKGRVGRRPVNFPYKLADKSKNEINIKIKKPEKKKVFVLLWQKTDPKSN